MKERRPRSVVHQAVKEGSPTWLEYITYNDESDKRGKFFSNFYGGLLVRSSELQPVIARLEQRKAELNLHREVKWQKVTGNYLAKYQSLMDALFGEIEDHRIKARVMFTQNQFIPTGLTADQRRRGKRTIAKEGLYRHIRERICGVYPNFNIGESTGNGGNWANLWLHPYRHWKFVRSEHRIDPTRTKK